MFERMFTFIAGLKERINKNRENLMKDIDEKLMLEHKKVKNGQFKKNMKEIVELGLEKAEKVEINKMTELKNKVITCYVDENILKMGYFVFDKQYVCRETRNQQIKNKENILMEDYVESEIAQFLEENDVSDDISLFLSLGFNFTLTGSNTVKISLSKNYPFKRAEKVTFKNNFNCIYNKCLSLLLCGIERNRQNITIVCDSSLNLCMFKKQSKKGMKMDNLILNTNLGDLKFDDKYTVNDILGCSNITNVNLMDVDHPVVQNRIEIKKRLVLEFIKAVLELSTETKNVNLILNGVMFERNKEYFMDELKKLKISYKMIEDFDMKYFIAINKI